MSAQTHLPRCLSQHTVKMAKFITKSPNISVKIVADSLWKILLKSISKETKDLVERLLLEKIPLAGIARAAQVSKKWLQDYVNKYTQVPQQIRVSDKLKGKIDIECDEAWSFVANKNNKQWIWLAG